MEEKVCWDKKSAPRPPGPGAEPGGGWGWGVAFRGRGHVCWSQTGSGGAFETSSRASQPGWGGGEAPGLSRAQLSNTKRPHTFISQGFPLMESLTPLPAARWRLWRFTLRNDKMSAES